ncbi:hypothetical protein HDU84_002647 [Entophlyctis sp. JEL0112]|nr:hypothetical protein HDU84_002647 [Entophlyctis sp. JEL0112]
MHSTYVPPLVIGNARASGLDASGFGNMERALGLASGQYNWALSVFFFGTDVRLIVTALRCSLLEFGFLLGVCEAGFFPGIAYYLSFWYTPFELGLRFGIFFTASSFAGAFGGVFGYFLVQVNLGFISDWRALFFFEGLPSILISPLVYFILPNYPQDASFLTPEERDFAVKRLKPYSIDSTDTEVDKVQLQSAFLDIKIVMFAFIYIGILTQTYGFTFYLPTLIKLLGYSNLNAQLFSSIPFICACVLAVLTAYTSDKTKDRSIHLLATFAFAAFGFLMLAFYRTSDGTQQKVLFGFMCLVVSATYVAIPISIVWMLNNTKGQTKSAVASAIMIGFGNLGGVIGPQICQCLSFR